MENKPVKSKYTLGRFVLVYTVLLVALIVLIFIAVNVGSLKVGFIDLIKGLFIGNDSVVSTIVDLRFPRIVISLFAGAGLAVSGALFQAVLKNPLADPGIIGISSGASFTAVIVSAVFPTLYFFTPIFAFFGGMLAFIIIYSLSYKGGLRPIRIILVGVAVNAMFTGLSSALNSMTGGNLSGVASIVNGNITMKTWDDVTTLLPYVIGGIILAIIFARSCNILALSEQTARGLGVDVEMLQIIISLIAVLLASICTAVVGTISFIGLIVPHIGRIFVGSDYKRLIPFSIILGAFTFLLADTLGRTIASPYEISASIIMSVVGGPFFIWLLKHSEYGAKN